MPFDISVKDLGKIVELSLNEIYLFDMETLKFEYVNRSARENLGYSDDELSGLTPLDLKPQLTREQFQNLLQPLRLNAELPVEFETVHRRKDGSNYFVEVHLQLIRYQERTLACAVILDVTERVNARRERAVADSQRYQAQNFQNMGVLASGLAHDFNNVLARMMGHVDLALLECQPDTELHSTLQELVTGINEIAALTMQMRYYSGLGKRQSKLANLEELLEQMRGFLQGIVQENCAIEYELAADLPAIEIDASQIRQVIVNLVYNAAEAIGDGKGRIRITAVRQFCDANYLGLWFPAQKVPPNDYVVLTVSDDGIGIAPETIPRIFDPFFSTKSSNSGLGLSAALGIVLGHRGNLSVYSEHGVGCSIVILLPLPRDHTDLLAVHSENTQLPIAVRTGTVLLVECNESVRLLLGNLLGSLGFTVITATDGREALNLFSFRHDEILLIIFGLSIPDNCDSESLNEMLHINKSIPLIVCSGFDIPPTIEQILKDAKFLYLRKPYHFQELLTTLNMLESI